MIVWDADLFVESVYLAYIVFRVILDYPGLPHNRGVL